MGRAMLSKSLIQFSADGWNCVPSLLFTWGQTVTSFKRSQAILPHVLPTPQQATNDPCLCRRLLDTHKQVSCGVTVPFSWVLVHKFLLCPPRVNFPVLCKFWQLYGGVNGDLLQEGLCHTQVCCTQNLCPCDRPPPYLHRRGSNRVLTQSLCGLWVLVHTRFV